mmetsp:Transcript_72638/g.193774  ORF Transcript_72638/g.193774 Transcript_72638/m.193774 type:complete len:102 (-) Transcript_72638:91-396(-)
MITCGLDGRILFWDVDIADPVGCLTADGKLLCVACSPSGRYIAAGGVDACLYIFDLQTCELLSRHAGHTGPLVRLAWSPDQKQIITAARDGCLCVWNFFEL